MSFQTKLYQHYLDHPRVITDSRRIEPGCLFFALKGPNFNGNQYAEEAILKGAAYAIIDEPEYDKGELYILVEDVLTTLQQLARHHRQQFEIPIIAITGSNGKTTSKELIRRVLGSHYRTHYTRGNLNNHIGVPLTLLEMDASTEVAIIEMGANHLGEIKTLTEITEPTHGLITNIGKAHLEGFGGIEGVKKGKGELYDFIAKKNKVVFINMEESYLTEMADKVRHKVYYKLSENPDPEVGPHEIKVLSLDPYVNVSFLGENQELVAINSALVGEYNLKNIMSAICIGKYFKVPGRKTKIAIEGYIPTNNRSQFVKRGSNTILMDAYNANPTSMHHALTYFSSQKGVAKIAVLGDMLELGAYSEAEHRDLVKFAMTLGFDQIWLVGKAFMALKHGTPRISTFENVEALKEQKQIDAFEQTHFLIKGSRGLKLENLLQ